MAPRTEYHREWRKKNPQHAEKKKAWKRGSEGYKKTERERMQKIRRWRRFVAIDALGWECCRCGFDDERALQFDHKTPLMRREKSLRNHGGCLEPWEFKAIIAGEKHDIQLLCANCHAIKSKHEDPIYIKQIKGL